MLQLSWWDDIHVYIPRCHKASRPWTDAGLFLCGVRFSSAVRKQFLRETPRNKVCWLYRWFQESDTAVEFFTTSKSVIQFHYVREKADIFKTRQQSRGINSSTGKRENMCFGFWGWTVRPRDPNRHILTLSAGRASFINKQRGCFR